MPITPVAYTGAKNISIQCDGTTIQELNLYQDEKSLLSVDTGDFEPESYQWQLLYDTANDPFWISIYDRTDETCEVSYALINNLLNASGETSIRCRVRSEDSEMLSDPVRIKVFQKEKETGRAETDMILMTDRIVLATDSDAFLATDSNSNYKNSTASASDAEKEETLSTDSNSKTATDSNSKKKFKAFQMRAAKEFNTITIKYLDISSLTSGKEAAIYSPYIATIENGSAFEQTVVSPTFLGFAPYYNSDDVDQDADGDLIDDDASQLKLDYDSVTEDIEIVVYYKPIEVDFKIRYFFQNINDDLYTERVDLYHSGRAETGTIITEEYIRVHAGDTTGYEKMYHIPESIAADGSTVFECYYDRNYYLMQFELDGGYGVAPIYARYGTSFIVNEPIRHGYVFKGWDLINIDTNGDEIADSGDGTPDSVTPVIPASGMRYQALWDTANTQYSVVYWLKNEKGTYNYIGSRIVYAQSGQYVSGVDDLDMVYLCGETHTHLSSCTTDTRYYEFERADQDVLVEGDGSASVNVYYKCKDYTLKFYYAMSSESGTDTIYYVIGGSTYFFGKNAGISDKHDEVALLGQYMGYYSTERGQVDELPRLNALGKERGYTHGSDKATVNGIEYTYHYISFTKPYGSDISQLWPCGVFDSVTRIGKNNANGWSGQEAFVSAWNGEHHVYYSQHNGNQTIKGNYMKLDENLLWDASFGDSRTVAYLCFWENGANIGWSVPELYRYNIYVEALEGQDLTGLVTEIYNGMTCYRMATYDTCDDSWVDQQTHPAMQGFNYLNYTYAVITDYEKDLYKEAYDVNFFYSRNEYDLSFYNYNKTVSGKNSTVPYQASLAEYYFVPEYPDVLEKNAYVFGGWYTTEKCYAGSEFGKVMTDTDGNQYYSFEGTDMPANDLRLYAKWVPNTHEVNFFSSYNDMLAYEAGDQNVSIHASYPDVTHGSVVGSVENPRQNGGGELDLIFAGWFYIENGKKLAFSPLDMPINRAMNIFADWSSKQPQPYRIEYVLRDAPTTKVAETMEGYAYGGSTRTFTAKAGKPFNQLYDSYNSGYFPTVGSHSITMQYEEDKENPLHNVYTFYYVNADDIEYTVQYVNKENNTLLEPATKKITKDAVVTERFKTFEDMVPDAFYKRLVISVEWDEKQNKFVGTEDNVITFYYTPNKTSAYYAVHYMLEKPNATERDKQNYKIDGTGGYEESGTSIEGVGDVGSLVSIIPQTFAGYALNTNVAYSVTGNSSTTIANVDGQYHIEITEEGTELYLFYNRLEYAYSIHFYLYNTTTNASDHYPHLTEKAKYGTTITYTAPTISGFTCVSAETTQSIQVRSNEAQNTIIFYYAPLQYVTEYVAVPADGGWLTNTIEVITGGEAFAGSRPNANQYYEFEGWYMDEACTEPVTEAADVNMSTGELIPDKSKLSETQSNIFYAKFVQKVGDFTISRANADEATQVFVYEVKNTKTQESIEVTITGNGSVTIHDLPLGEYVVTQKGDWSWRYTDEARTCTHDDVNGSSTNFNKTVQNPYWLNGISALIKNRKKGE